MPYLEEQFCERFLGQLCRARQIVIQGCVHHAWVHCVNCYRVTSDPQLVLQVVGEQQQGQFTLGVCTMSTVTHPVQERESGGKERGTECG